MSKPIAETIQSVKQRWTEHSERYDNHYLSFQGAVEHQVDLGVVELEKPPAYADLKRRFVEAGVWIRPFGNVVYLMPALTIEPDERRADTSADGPAAHS